MIQSIASHEAAAQTMREFVGNVLVGRIVAAVAPDQHELRAGLCGAQVFGMGMVRYVLKLEPVASADHATLIAAVAPSLQRYLTAPLT
jgi:Tetracyclin repressor-like, C-terminal domain